MMLGNSRNQEASRHMKASVSYIPSLGSFIHQYMFLDGDVTIGGEDIVILYTL